MNYIQVALDTKGEEDFVADVISALLADVGFESFEQKEGVLFAYCQKNSFSEEAMKVVLNSTPLTNKVAYEVSTVEAQNWNEEWEQNSFKPIKIANRCIVHHPKEKVAACEYDILIDPKMAFGTACHDTTYQIVETLLQMNMNGKRVLDMGCGTGVLGIVAAKCGAAKVTAIDIDDFSYENAKHNAALNVVDIDVMLGDASLLHDMEFDLILANINRNILLNDMSAYVGVLAIGGEVLFSGFYTEDIPFIERKANEFGLHRVEVSSRNNWAIVRLKKQ